jgi:hypothetical protein
MSRRVMAPSARACDENTVQKHRPQVAKMPANNVPTAAAAAAAVLLFSAVIQGDPFVLMWKKATDDRLRARGALEAQRVRGPRHRVERPQRGRPSYTRFRFDIEDKDDNWCYEHLRFSKAHRKYSFEHIVVTAGKTADVDPAAAAAADMSPAFAVAVAALWVERAATAGPAAAGPAGISTSWVACCWCLVNMVVLFLAVVAVLCTMFSHAFPLRQPEFHGANFSVD